MTEAQKTVLNMTSAALFGTPVSVSDETDWQAVYDEVKSQEIVSLLYPLTENLSIPESVLAQWSVDRDKYLLNNAKNIGGHFSVQKLMDSAGVPCVILKGLASASYYPDYLLRAFGDVDFIVSEKDYRKAAALLKKSGYSYRSQHDKHKVFYRDGRAYELHRDIVGFPSNSVKKVLSKYYSDFFESARPFTHMGHSCMIPSDRHHAIILLAHTANHLSSSGLGLRHLCDWTVFVDRMPDEFFSEDMKDILQKTGLWHFAGILTNFCSEYLGLRKCEWAEEASSEYMESLLDDVFISGEFGHNYDRAVENNPELQSRYSDLFKPGSLRALFSVLNIATKAAIPAAAKVPLLLPVGWIFITFRYGVRMLKGTRSTADARDAVVRRSNKQSLSDEWHLFEK